MTAFANALASPVDQPDQTFRALEAAVAATIGARLFTIMTFDYDRHVGQRRYSNMSGPYPTSAEKPFPDTLWTETVLRRHETFVANDLDGIAAVFPDYATIEGLGLASCINIPIVVTGRVLGTLNCLHDKGHYHPARVQVSNVLKEAGAAALLMAERPQPGS